MLTLLLFIIHSFFHPFHVSVTDIKYKEKEQALQISTRIFLEDMEKTLRLSSGNTTLDITSKTEWESHNTLIRDYFFKKFSIYDHNSNIMNMTYIGAEIDKDVIWVYTEIAKVKKLKSYTIDNRLLIEEITGQENIIHFRVNDRVKTVKTYKKDTKQLFQWN